MNSAFLALIKKDLRGYFDQPTGYILIIVFTAMLSRSYFETALLINEASLRPLFTVEFAIDKPSLPWLMTLFIPAATMRLLSEELRDGTLETLLTQPIRAWVILVAKFTAGLIFVSIAIFTTLSIPLTLMSAGDLDWGAIVCQYIASILLAGALVSIGLFTSSLTRNQIVSFILGLTLSMILMIVGLEIVAITLPSTIARLLQLLSPVTHFTNVGRGIIDLRDVLYFVSVIFAFLSATFLILKSRTLSHKTTQYRNLQLGVTGLIILSVLIGWFGTTIKGRLDLTEDKIFSLSPATVEIIDNLEDLMTVDIFLSKNPAVELLAASRDINDFLDDVEANSNGMIKIARHYPEEDARSERKANNAGIQPRQFNTSSQGKLEITSSYLGLNLTYLDRREIIPFTDSVNGFEYRLISLANRMLSSSLEKKTVGFLTGHNETQAPEEFATFGNLLNQQYQVVMVGSEADQAINLNNIDVLIISSPKSRIPGIHRSSILEYIKSGGKSLFMIEPVLFDSTQFSGISNREDFSDFIYEEFKLTIEKDLVFDIQSNETISSPTGVSARYPYFIRAQVQDSKIGKEVTNIVMLWASSIGIANNTDSEYKITSLISTSPYGAIDFSFRNLSPNSPIFNAITEDQLVQSDLAVTIEGENGSRSVVIGDSDWLQEYSIQRFQTNYLLGLNIVDWLAQEDNLAQVRSKIATQRNLIFSSDTHRTIVQLFNIAGLPIAIILFGLLRFFNRRNKGLLRQFPGNNNKETENAN